MKQNNILSFIGKKEEDYLIPYNFVLEWKNDKPIMCMFLFDNQLDKKNYIKIGSFHWKDFSQDINIYYKEDKETTIFKSRKKNYTTLNISLLKSTLQKAIRRQNIELSINIAFQMINLDFNEFIRRFLIIILEDVCFNLDYIYLVWFLCASSTKNLILKKKHVKWILGYIKFIANNDYQFNYEKKESLNIDFIKKDNIFKLHYDLLLSLLLRKSFGGMNGDLKMINYYLDYYYKKFKNIKIGEHFPELIINIEPISYKFDIINVIDFPLESVDFHCFNNLVTLIFKNYNNYSEEDIKKSIWFCSSSINYRNKIKYDEKYDEIYNKIKDYKKKLSLDYLYSNRK